MIRVRDTSIMVQVDGDQLIICRYLRSLHCPQSDMRLLTDWFDVRCQRPFALGATLIFGPLQSDPIVNKVPESKSGSANRGTQLGKQKASVFLKYLETQTKKYPRSYGKACGGRFRFDHRRFTGQRSEGGRYRLRLGSFSRMRSKHGEAAAVAEQRQRLLRSISRCWQLINDSLILCERIRRSRSIHAAVTPLPTRPTVPTYTTTCTNKYSVLLLTSCTTYAPIYWASAFSDLHRHYRRS